MKICEVCRGRQTIRLPLYKPVAVSVEAMPDIAESPYRDYPCPECAPTVKADRVKVIEHFFQADTSFEDEQGYREYLVANACHAIAHNLQESNLVRMQEAPESRYSLTRKYRVSVGVVSPKEVADRDQERERAEEAFASSVVDIAIAEITNWGSYYGHSGINKDIAADFIRAALGKAKGLRPKTPSWA